MTAIEKTTANLMLSTFDQGAVMRHLGLNPNDPATQALLLVCQKYDLDPILKHALLIKGRLYVTRDGLLHVAHRSGVFDGMEVLDQGSDQTHFTAKVSVYRKDMGRPFTYIGRYPKSGQIAKDYGPEMAVKVAEVMAMRRAFDVALCAQEERWDEEAQRETAQVDQGRRTDVTREVQEAAGTPAHTVPAQQPAPKEELLQRWASSIGDMTDRVRKVAPAAEVQSILDTYNWRADLDAARACHADLKALGLKHAPKTDAQPAQTQSEAQQPAAQTDAEPMATAAQIGQLQAAAKGMGADTSAVRAMVWGHLLQHTGPVSTKQLSEAEATWLLNAISHLSPEQRAAKVKAAQEQFSGAPF
ncbi:hypothetical protein K7W42_18105 [Deinococcus sp. HMF7604]|uniref:hypothetical protein n=1 Tax=Deinococcus betulae TaxID=2873312 RepID=UPI001CCA7E6B|nr:hypothetical protein [Deinococcus betulae]MBZ9752758.1 hypothetical protein [Deinococcus betulae]